MHRVDTEGHVGNLFVDGNPQLGQQGTIFSHAWANDVQENICHVIVEAGIELEKGDGDQLLLAIQTLIAAAAAASRVKPGTIAMHAGEDAPAGWLECDGSEQLIATYPDLAEVCGTTFGAAAALHFKLPDFRGYAPRGWDNGRGIDAGRVLGSTQADQNKQHTHAAKHATSPGSANDTVANGGIMTDDPAGGQVTVTWMVADEGGAEARMKNLAVPFIIKT